MIHEIHESLAALCTAAAAQSTAPHIILDCLKHLLDLWSRCAPPSSVCLEEKNSFKIANVNKITKKKLRTLYRRTCDVLLSDVHRDWLGCFSSAEIISSFDSFFHPSVVQPILVLESLLASLEKRERCEEVVVEEEEEEEEEEERGKPANGDGRKATLSVAHSNVLQSQQVVRETPNERRARVAKYASLLRKLVVGIKEEEAEEAEEEEEEEEKESHSSGASSMLLGSSLGSSLLHLVLSEGERQRAVDLHRSILVVPDVISKSLR